MPPPQTSGPRVRVVYASFWRRFWALVLDAFFLVIALSALALVTGGSSMDALGTLFVVVYMVGLTSEGGTLGKRALGLRVVTLDGQHPTVLAAFLREVVRPLSAAAAGFGFLWMLDDPQRQTWHDLVAATIVVRELPVAVAPAWAAQPPWQPRGMAPPSSS